MDFYTNVVQLGNQIFVRGYHHGKRAEYKEEYKPYLFIKKPNGPYTSLHGQPVDKIEFDSIKDAKDFIRSYKDVSNFEILGLDRFNYLHIFDRFKGEIDYDPTIANIVYFDIETDSSGSFPNIETADKEITAITLRHNGISYVFACGEFTPPNETVKYLRCKSEANLLQNFLRAWEALDIDIVTGWNIEFFDIPYIVNRIKRVLGQTEHKKLSPWRLVFEKNVNFKGRKNHSYNVVGISTLDYYQLYRKFTFGNRESYSLDFISEYELGEKKIDYAEYGSLDRLYKENYQLYIEYNIHDCVLVERLEDKLKFLEQVMALAFNAKVNFEDTLATIIPWDVLIHNYLLERKIVIPFYDVEDDEDQIEGGFVKEPLQGLKKWLVTFDLNSLYPHLIMMFNIGPETFIGKYQIPNVESLLQGKWSAPDKRYVFAANGCAYSKEHTGVMATIMESMYNGRVEYKAKMIQAKKDFEISKSNADEKLVARYHNMQMAMKIMMNSGYGALASKYFRWYNLDNAEAVTVSGQLAVRWIMRKLNEYMNRIVGTHDVDYVVAGDTDSVTLTFGPLVEKVMSGITDEMTILKNLDKFIEEKVQPFIDKSYEELAEKMNANENKLKMKREAISTNGIWRGKKMYILNTWNVEGVQYEKPKLKAVGIETERSSNPKVAREALREALWLVLNKDEQELQDYVKTFRSKFESFSIKDISFPRGVNTKLYDYNKSGGLYDKGTPIHIKAAILFNRLLLDRGIQNVPPIHDGDKIKFVYLIGGNPINENVIGFIDKLPPEFGLDKYVDKDTQFDKTFLSPLKSFTSLVGWEPEKVSNLEDFFG